ncbi:MAG: CBS domain-containing protein [Actinobacteria bacterium]|nr:CBS domain-containing protein [Actinomycetota bacterium]
MRVEQVLASKGDEVLTIHPDASTSELVSQLAEHRIGAMVVSRDGRTVDGMASERDVVRALAKLGAAALDKPVSELMTPTVQCAVPSAYVQDLMSLMTNSRIRHVPVLDEEHQMIGIISIGDVVKSRIDELQDERDALVQYVTVGG